jgi:protein phosphatase/serine/threonine-protein phosphatase Stp1
MTGFRSFVATDTGPRRHHNEDNYADRPGLGLWAVADGAGGHEAGEVASGMIRAALEAIPPGLDAAEMLAEVRGQLLDVHTALREEAARRGPGAMIASTVVVLLARGNHYAALWAGDSRIYLLRDGALSPVTRDHSLVQEMVDAGTLAAAEAERHPYANVITRAVGAGGEALELETATDAAQPGDRFLLCSDGLTKTLPEAEIAALLAGPDDTDPAQRLLAAALARNAGDNVTALVVIWPGAKPNE